MARPMVREAAELMLQAMKDLSAKKITAQEAQSLAQLGISVVQAANVEVSFIKATKAIPADGVFGTDVRFLEPPEQDNGKKTGW